VRRAGGDESGAILEDPRLFLRGEGEGQRERHGMGHEASTIGGNGRGGCEGREGRR